MYGRQLNVHSDTEHSGIDARDCDVVRRAFCVRYIVVKYREDDVKCRYCVIVQMFQNLPIIVFACDVRDSFYLMFVVVIC